MYVWELCVCGGSDPPPVEVKAALPACWTVWSQETVIGLGRSTWTVNVMTPWNGPSVDVAKKGVRLWMAALGR